MQKNYSTNYARRANGAVNGEIDGDVFRRNVIRERHLMQKMNAYSLDAAQVDALQARGIRTVEFHEDTGRIYVTSLAEFTEHGFVKQFPGYLPQRFLPLRYWQDVTPSQSQAGPVGETFTPAPEYSQDRLF